MPLSPCKIAPVQFRLTHLPNVDMYLKTGQQIFAAGWLTKIGVDEDMVELVAKMTIEAA